MSSHPYTAAQTMSGVEHFPGASKLSIEWDPQTATEYGYDYLRLYTADPDALDSERHNEIMIRGNGDDGRWTGSAGETVLSCLTRGVNLH